MYTPHIMIDSRELIREKFMKKTRIHNTIKSDSIVSYVNESEQKLDLDDSSMYDSEKKYNYLFDDPLSREFEYDDTTLLDKQIFVCLYKQNTDLALPYITFSLVNSNNMLSFPNITIPIISDNLDTINSEAVDESIVDKTVESDVIQENEEAVENEIIDEKEEDLETKIETEVNNEVESEIIDENIDTSDNDEVENSQEILPIEETDNENNDIENNQDNLSNPENINEDPSDEISQDDIPSEKDDNENNIDANIENIDTSINNENDDENDDYLFTQCSQYINNNVVLESNITYECYKGFVEFDGNIYAFFDITYFDYNDNFIDNTTNCTIDELMQSKKIPGLIISENVSNLFHTENILQNIYDMNNKPIHNPITVYLCENVDGEYINSTNLDTNNSMSLITEKIDHPVVGNTYLFTSKLLETSNVDKYKRYALFHNDAVFVLHEPFIKNEYDMIQDNACVCFMSEGIEYWSVKNIDLFAEI